MTNYVAKMEMNNSQEFLWFLLILKKKNLLHDVGSGQTIFLK